MTSLSLLRPDGELMKCKKSIGSLFLAVALFATAATTYAGQPPSQDAIAPAKALYEAAEYDAALAALNKLWRGMTVADHGKPFAITRTIMLECRSDRG